MIVYTIIGYKPNGVDSVMGCVQDRVDSDFLIETYRDKEQAALQVAQMNLEEPYSEYMQHDWEETIVLFNGEDNKTFGWDALYENRDPKCEQAIEEFFALVEQKEQEIKDEREAKRKADAEAKRISMEAKRKQAAQAKEEAELAQLAALKAKYDT